MSWKDRSACGPDTAHLFFPVNRPGKSTAIQAQQAKRICAECPVYSECLEESLSSELGIRLDGIWAGLSRTERKRKYRHRLRAQAERNAA